MRKNYQGFLKSGLLMGIASLLVSCGEAVRDDVIDFSDDDAEMNAAMDEGRATFQQFVDAAPENLDEFDGMIKVYFLDDPSSDGELMWVSPTNLEGPAYEGILMSDPRGLTSVDQGDDVSFSLEEISDWLYVKDGAARGAYTVMVMRSRMTPEDLAEHDAAYPFKFEGAE
jgi:uncharacterized protein YegJ (DUF2314 family)